MYLVSDAKLGVNSTRLNSTLIANTTHTFGIESPIGESFKALADSGITNLLILLLNWVISYIVGSALNQHEASADDKLQIEYPIVLVYWLSMIENTDNKFQSTKKTDERQDEAFATERAAQDAYSKATNGGDRPKQTVAITGSMWRTFRYLSCLGGPLLIWAGAIFMSFSEALDTKAAVLLNYLVKSAGGDPTSQYVAALTRLLIDVLMIPIVTAWAHHVIANHPPASQYQRRGIAAWKRYFRDLLVPRLPPLAAMKYMIVPTIMVVGLDQIVALYPGNLVYNNVLKPLLASDTRGAHVRTFLAVAYFMESTAYTVVSVIVKFVLGILHVRVTASTLPEFVQTVVPMDRSFGLKRKPENGITLWEAWKTLSWSTIWRVTQVAVKKEIVFFLLTMGFSFLVLVVEAFTPGYHLEDQHGKPAVPAELQIN